jgi:hypothetical protein
MPISDQQPSFKKAPRAVVQHPNVQAAVKILGTVVMATKCSELDTTFNLVDEFGVSHQFHLNIKENKILLADG